MHDVSSSTTRAIFHLSVEKNAAIILSNYINWFLIALFEDLAPAVHWKVSYGLLLL